MRICYVGNFTRESAGEWEVAESLEELGQEVLRIDERSTNTKEILEAIKNNKSEVLLYAKLRVGTYEEIKNLLEEVRAMGIKSVMWLFDIYFGYGREGEVRANPAFKADMVFTTDGGHQKEFESLGINHSLLRQGIYQKEAYLGKPIHPVKSPIVFIGTNYGDYRNKLINFLSKTYGDKFKHLGQTKKIRGEELNNLCATAKIVVGDSFYSPYYWSNRIYEIIGRGGFFIHPRVIGLDSEFSPYKHFIPYDFGDFNHLKEIIDFYLAHDKEREKIRIAGFKHCLKNHTYLIRTKELLKQINGKNFKRNKV